MARNNNMGSRIETTECDLQISEWQKALLCLHNLDLSQPVLHSPDSLCNGCLVLEPVEFTRDSQQYFAVCTDQECYFTLKRRRTTKRAQKTKKVLSLADMNIQSELVTKLYKPCHVRLQLLNFFFWV